MKPQRVQRQRTKGWRMPPNTVYVGRPTKWGNPYAGGGSYWDRLRGFNEYRRRVTRITDVAESARLELRGKNLACWCPLGQPCHADVLLDVANGEVVA